MLKIRYKDGYKYQLVQDYEVRIEITGHNVKSDFIELTSDGRLKIKKYYCWDGPSGITVDTKNFMRGSLIHDALYQLMRESYSPSRWIHFYKQHLIKVQHRSLLFFPR